MAENMQKPSTETGIESTLKAPVQTDNNVKVKPENQVSLIEMIMILMLVGLVFVFVFGMQQMKINKEKEAIAQQKFESILPTFDRIVAAANEYRKNDPFGAYPLSLEELNLKDINNADFVFSYTEMGPVITATTTKEFGKEGIAVNYNIAAAVYEVSDPNPQDKPTVHDDWLP
ncbi:MAG: hypothetical protein Q8M98_07805 [Candidatus Cloacimonadaceae bacterium]|nr:hypothetical protein [Candidatus Cloacimonadaceae bacterium]MDP3114668.1 hypothetical protein [Candidatus Cloacimonadaceae bacterium]